MTQNDRSWPGIAAMTFLHPATRRTATLPHANVCVGVCLDHLVCAESTFSHIGGRSDGISLGLGTSSFTRTNFDSSPIINADKALLRLYDDHVMKLDVRSPIC